MTQVVIIVAILLDHNMHMYFTGTCAVICDEGACIAIDLFPLNKIKSPYSCVDSP